MNILEDKNGPEDFDYEEILKNIRKGMIEQREECRKWRQMNPVLTESDCLDNVMRVTDPLDDLLKSFIYDNTNIYVFGIISSYVLERRDDLDECMKEIMLSLMTGIDETINFLKMRIDALEPKKRDIESMMNKLKGEE